MLDLQCPGAVALEDDAKLIVRDGCRRAELIAAMKRLHCETFCHVSIGLNCHVIEERSRRDVKVCTLRRNVTGQKKYCTMSLRNGKRCCRS
jgi:hypothetical protein